MQSRVGPACKSLLHEQFQCIYNRDTQLFLRLPL